MLGDLVDAFINTLKSDGGFMSYVGKALMILALVGPLAYCESQSATLRHEDSMAKTNASAELQKVCIEQRGEWNAFREKCELRD